MRSDLRTGFIVGLGVAAAFLVFALIQALALRALNRAEGR